MQCKLVINYSFFFFVSLHEKEFLYHYDKKNLGNLRHQWKFIHFSIKHCCRGLFVEQSSTDTVIYFLFWELRSMCNINMICLRKKTSIELDWLNVLVNVIAQKKHMSGLICHQFGEQKMYNVLKHKQNPILINQGVVVNSDLEQLYELEIYRHFYFLNFYLNR